MDWFNGNSDAQDLYDKLSYVSHLWDDLIDKEERTEDDINRAFLACFIQIPMNRFYQKFQTQLIPLLHTGMMGYMTANKLERSGDAHQVEIAHGLRYAIAQVIVFMVMVTNSHERALELLPHLWQEMMPERWDDYAKEHL